MFIFIYCMYCILVYCILCRGRKKSGAGWEFNRRMPIDTTLFFSSFAFFLLFCSGSGWAKSNTSAIDHCHHRPMLFCIRSCTKANCQHTSPAFDITQKVHTKSCKELKNWWKSIEKLSSCPRGNCGVVKIHRSTLFFHSPPSTPAFSTYYTVQ